MIIGILAESPNDSIPLSKIVTRIIKEVYPEGVVEKYITEHGWGNIVHKMGDAVTLFFSLDPKCNFAIFINDLDGLPERCKKIRSWVTNYMSKSSENYIIVACPENKYEEWLIIEENAVKKVLNINATEALPHAQLEPKSRLEKLIIDYDKDITRSKPEIYTEISESLNIETLRLKSRSFKRFHQELVNLLRSIHY